jgi:hypothetical protein
MYFIRALCITRICTVSTCPGAQNKTAVAVNDMSLFCPHTILSSRHVAGSPNYSPRPTMNTSRKQHREIRVTAWIQNFLEPVHRQKQGRRRERLRQGQARLLGWEKISWDLVEIEET